MKVELVESSHAIGMSGPLVVSMWRTVTTHTAMLSFRAMVSRYVTGQPDGIAFLTVVEAQAEMPEPAARDELADMFRRLGSSVICSALVFEGQGFRAAAVRGITTSVNLLARQPFPHKVFANVDEAASWMGKHSSGRVSIGQSMEGAATLRSALDAKK